MSAAPLTVVLLHGAGASGAVWRPQLAALQARWPILVPDLPGRGATGGAGRESVEAYAAWVEAYLDGEGVERALLVGHSLGGAIALLVALRGRARLAGLGLVSTGARLRVDPELLRLLEADFDAAVERLLGLSFGPAPPDVARALVERELRAAGPATTRGDFLACDRFDLMDRLGEVGLPTLVMVGETDRLTPPKYARFLAERIVGAELEQVEDAGHYVQLERPVAVSAALARLAGGLGDG